MRPAFSLLLFCLLISTVAIPQPNPPDSVFDNAIMARTPRAALVQGVDATVRLACQVSEHSAWNHCALVSEDPPGQGFGDAALALAKNFPTETATFTPRPSAVATVTFHHSEITTEALGVTHIIRPPDWAERPSARQLSSLINWSTVPHQVISVTINCIVTAKGKLDPCRVREEEPNGFGIGQRALAMAHVFKMRPLAFDGSPRGGAYILIPIRIMSP